MLALVLSGGANYGSMQAGAIRAVYEAGYLPDIITGISAGSLNASYLSIDSSEERTKELCQQWAEVTSKDLGNVGLFSGVRHLISHRESLLPSENLQRFILNKYPQDAITFHDAFELSGVHVFVGAVDLETGKLRVFGDLPTDKMIDGTMASTALPPYYAPWRCDGKRWIDGGAVCKLPIRMAIERGAKKIIALNLNLASASSDNADNMLKIIYKSISIMAEQNTKQEIIYTERIGIPYKVIHLIPPPSIGFWDYSKADDLISAGYDQTKEEMKNFVFKKQTLKSKFKGLLFKT